MTSKEKLTDLIPNAHVYYYHSLDLYGETTKVYCVTIGSDRYEAETEAKACKLAINDIKLKIKNS